MRIDLTQAQLEVENGFAEGQRTWCDVLESLNTARLATIERLKAAKGEGKKRGGGLRFPQLTC